MNFIDVTVVKNGDGADLKVGPYTLKAPADKAAVLLEKGYDGKTVVMGIRPENISDDPEVVASSEAVVEAKVNVYELLGAEVFLYFDLEGNPCTARVDPHTKSKMGDTVKFALDTSRSLFFDKETELSITY
jgi:multiple sugar transport system ATP-binding protein